MLKKIQYFRRLLSYYSKHKINTYEDLSLEIAMNMKNVVIFNKFINIMKHSLKNVHISNIKCDIIVELKLLKVMVCFSISCL